MPSVQPAILVWARETAGFTRELAAEKLGIGDARGVSGVERLARIESGAVTLKRPLLLKMAKLYRRPLVTFYMGAPPRRGVRGEDYRTLPERSTESEPLIDALVRDVRARQSMVRAVLADEDEAEPLPFIGSMSMRDGVGDVLASIRRTLGIDLETFRAQGSAEGGFSLLRNKAESLGIFVLLIGNLGSHHSTIDVGAFRGFAIADAFAPFIVINDGDAKSAWSFTLVHELAHLWIGESGVSGGTPTGVIEQFCNDVASGFLLPSNDLSLLQVEIGMDRGTLARIIEQFAEERLVSRSLVAYRLFRAGTISEEAWRDLTGQFRAEWLERRASGRAQAREQSQTGPSYYVVRRHRLGPALLRFVARSMNEGVLTPTKAGKVLGVKPRNVQPLLSGGTLPSGRAA